MFNINKPIKPHEVVLRVVNQYVQTFSVSQGTDVSKTLKVTSVGKFVLTQQNDNRSATLTM